MAKRVLTQEQYEILEDNLSGSGDLRPDYSGRGMYGATCLGFVTDEGSAAFQMALAEILAPELLGLGDDDEVGLDEVKEAMEELGKPSSDSMGRSAIYYYRQTQVEGHEREGRF